MKTQTIKEAMELLESVDKYKQQRDRQEGRLEQLESRLQTEFGCSSLEEAKVTLESMLDKKEKLEDELKEKLTEFNREYGDKLDSV